MPICKRCEKEAEHVSKRGLCMECGIGAVLEAARQMHEKKGPIYEKLQARAQERKSQMKLVE